MKQAFVAVSVAQLLRRHGLNSFEALWETSPSEGAGKSQAGWHSVRRLELEDFNGHRQSFYLKRQEIRGHRSFVARERKLSCVREFRALQSCARRGIPVPEAAFFAERNRPGLGQAILLTRALDAYRPLTVWLGQWRALTPLQRDDLVRAGAALVRALHNADTVHNDLHPRHLFLKLDGDGAGARLIDLERTRRAWFGERDRVRDLSSLMLRCTTLSRTQRLRFLLAYLGIDTLNTEARRLARRVELHCGKGF